MPDNEQTVSETTESSTLDAFNAAYDEAETDDEEVAEESEDATAEGGETEEDTEETEEVEAESSDDNDEEEEDDDYLALDGSVAEKLPEDVRKRYEQQVKGVKKRDRQLSEREAVLQKDEKGFKVYQSYADAFSDPDHARTAYEQLGKQLAEVHKWDKAEAKEEYDSEAGTYVYEGKTFYSERELELYKEVQELKNRKVEDPELEEIKAEMRRRREADAQKAWVDSNQHSIIGKVQGKTGGWGVTKDQIAEAYAKNPDGLKSKPVETLKSMYPDSYAEWFASKKGRREMPEIIDSTDVKGLNLPKNKADWSFEDHAAALGI